MKLIVVSIVSIVEAIAYLRSMIIHFLESPQVKFSRGFVNINYKS